MTLIATYPILHHSHQYEVGDTLPVNDTDMVQAWIDAKTAAWQEDETPQTKAKPVTAEAGLAGQSPNGETDENVVGKVPKTPARSRAKKNG